MLECKSFGLKNVVLHVVRWQYVVQKCAICAMLAICGTKVCNMCNAGNMWYKSVRKTTGVSENVVIATSTSDRNRIGSYTGGVGKNIR